MAQHWINTISLEHVDLGVVGGFTQAGHGKDVQLRKLQRGDGLAFYSPRTALRSGEPLQQFTALGIVADDEPYQVEVSDDWHPWRRRVDFEEVEAANIRPLLDDLDFIPDKQRWGFPFRRGLFEVPLGDFNLITQAMRSTSVSQVARSSGTFR